jgi:thymidylate synthase (FAD)
MEIVEIPNTNITDQQCQIWKEAMHQSERFYQRMIEAGAPPQIARSVLPNSLKTEVIATFNIREWRHVFRLRAISKDAHPQMRQLMAPVLISFRNAMPVLFEDLGSFEGDLPTPLADVEFKEAC